MDTLVTVLTLLTGHVDAVRILAHANMVRSQTGVHFSDASALALAWLETRSGRTGNSARGPGVWAHRTTRQLCRRVVCMPGDSIKINREIGRMQLSPGHDYTKLDSRCTLQAIKNSLELNIHCGLLWFVEKIKLCNGDLGCGIERYNGNGCIDLTHTRRVCSSHYRIDAATYIGMLYLKGWTETAHNQ